MNLPRIAAVLAVVVVGPTLALDDAELIAEHVYGGMPSNDHLRIRPRRRSEIAL